MAEDGGHGGGPGAADHIGDDQPSTTVEHVVTSRVEDDEYPISPRVATPNPFSRKNTSMDLDDYFTGPRDIAKHSKWPLFLQMHGSILPKMVVPLLAVAAWASIITAISEKVVYLGIESILLTVTGFVVGLGLSFRSSTAYERYAEGRRFWSQLTLTCQTLGRVFWIHTVERPGAQKKDILAKVTAMNLVVAFSVSLKHKLRFEPYSDYAGLADLIEHLDTFARSATDDNVFKPKEPGFFKSAGDHLGLSFAASNPRKAIKKAESPLGNLPLEILCYLSAYADEVVGNGQLPVPMTQTMLYNGIQALNDVLTSTERILTTPLPIAYSIAISQITWVYVFLLPFQLLSALGWITIPANIAAAYIILGILFIGREIENPFGNDVNDLPLELYCQQVMQDMETIAARPKPRMSDYVESPRNKVLYPHSESSYNVWASRSEPAIRQALRNRPYSAFEKTEKANGTNKEKGDNNV
ncbi:Bestrophin, RFP-TM, chloride channel-domain-containing protein [Xylariales sp. AK1849]|nr:Bestrophin, RFP-TM, chloride channel-domain-containing protein [Xylariales sp. AK1849]